MNEYEFEIKYGEGGERHYPINFLFRGENLYGIYEVRSNVRGKETKINYIGDVNSEIKGLIPFTGRKYIKHSQDILLTAEEADRLYPEYFI